MAAESKRSSASSLKSNLDSGGQDTANLSSTGQVDENKLFRKLDWRILPIITLLYLLAFLDRTNIGNAKVAGLSKDLKLVGLQYNVAAAIFFIPYVLFEVPSNLAMVRFKPAHWLALIMIIWGIIVISMGFVKKYPDLLAARFFLGIPEAGLLPGASYYLSKWYPRRRLAQRLALFVSASTLAGAFGGVLAFGIQHMEGVRGLHGWSWIFILEGILTVICAVMGLFFLPNYPEESNILSPSERAHLIKILNDDAIGGAGKKFTKKGLGLAMKDYKTYLYGILLFTVVLPAYCFALFVPSFIQSLGFTAAKAQAMSTPPFAVACALTFVVGKLSDRYRMRGPFVCLINILGIIGYAVLFVYGGNLKLDKTGSVGYGASILACCGLFPNVALIISWAGSNVGGDVKRSVVLAIVLAMSNFAGFPASFVFRQQDAPRYHPGYATCIGCLVVAFLLSAFMSWNFSRLNKLKEIARENKPKEGLDEDKVVAVDKGDDDANYVYMI